MGFVYKLLKMLGLLLLAYRSSAHIHYLFNFISVRVMVNDYFLKQHNVTDEQREMLSSLGILDDDTILVTLLKLAEKTDAPNPYYKFVEVLRQVEKRDKVLISDLESLDEYYDENLVKELLTNHEISEYYTGGAFREKSQLAKYLNSEYSTFDYESFHKYLSGLY